ncbi:MAG: hypothetical protein H0U00_10270 [Actinobacteria bacterium]|nr:hypothetical protein [Actinomycetota bacterium]
MPEGDSIHRAARRLQALVGQRVEVETPNPRAGALNIARSLDGRRLESVEAIGKNLLLHFEGGVTLRSHLRMKGRWRIRPRGEVMRGAPWLILRSAELEASQWNGPVLELRRDGLRRLGPDILEQPPDLETMIARLRRAPELPLAEALQRQQLVAGIGNMWAAEALWASRLSPWLSVRNVSDDELESLLGATHRMMSGALDGSRRPARRVYRRAGRSCRRCGTPIRSQGQGEANRTAYWCPTCQPISST